MFHTSSFPGNELPRYCRMSLRDIFIFNDPNPVGMNENSPRFQSWEYGITNVNPRPVGMDELIKLTKGGREWRTRIVVF